MLGKKCVARRRYDITNLNCNDIIHRMSRVYDMWLYNALCIDNNFIFFFLVVYLFVVISTSYLLEPGERLTIIIFVYFYTLYIPKVFLAALV